MSRFMFLFVVVVSLGISDRALANDPPRSAVVVTGASSGIGHQTALLLADRGYHVFAGARKPADIDALSRLPNIQGVRLDVTVQADIDAVVEQVKASGRPLAGIVNNAGVALFDALIEVSEDEMQFMMDVNLFGPYRVTRAFADLLIRDQGRVVTISSVAGIVSGQFFGPYSMSKHATEAFTDSLAREMAKFDVSVSAIEPGNFNSRIMQNLAERRRQQGHDRAASRFDAEWARFEPFTQTDRSHHQDPIHVAEAVHHALSAEAPKRRYLVTPNQNEATMTLRGALQRVVQLNQDHRHSVSNDELMALLQNLLSSEAP